MRRSFRLKTSTAFKTQPDRRPTGALTGLLFLLINFLPLTAQEIDPKGVLDEELIRQTSTEIDGGNADYQSIITRLMPVLNNYHRLYIKDKKIKQDRDHDGFKNSYMSGNDIRLQIRRRLTVPGYSRYINDIPALFYLHRNLGISYQNTGRPALALAHYNSSLRYRQLSSSEKVFMDTSRSRFLPQAEEARVEEYRQVKRNLLADMKEVERRRRQLAAHRDRQASGLPNNLAGVQQSLQQAENSAAQNRQRYEQLEKDVYGPFATAKIKTDADLLFRMAETVKTIENNNKRRLRVESRTNYGSAILNDYTENRDFVGYADLVELAHRINPEEPLYIEKLSDEFKHSRKLAKAIHFTKTYINNERAKKENPAVVALMHFRLGGLYTNDRDYLKASDQFELFLEKSQNDPENERLVYFYLGDLNYRRIGNLPAARRWFEQWLQNTADPASLSFPDQLRQRQRAFEAYQALAEMEKKRHRDRDELSFLQAAETEYRVLQKFETEQAQEMATLENEVLELKKKLRDQTDQFNSSSYTRTLDDLQQTKETWRQAYSARRQVNIEPVRLRMGEILEKYRRYNLASNLYQTMLKENQAVPRVRKRMQVIRNITNLPP